MAKVQTQKAKKQKVKPTPSTAATNGKVIVTQTGSKIGRTPDQEQTLIGLGLNKRHKSRELIDTPSVRGMINKVRHLLDVKEEAK